MSTAARHMTVEEFLELPDDGVERWLIDGELRENGMTKRNRDHSYLMARFAQFLGEWATKPTPPHGQVVCGEAGVRFDPDAATAVGIDVGFIAAHVWNAQTNRSSIIVGVPTLIVEILSPTDKQGDVAERVRTYLAARVPHVWVVDPDFQTVMVHRPQAVPFSVGKDGVLTAEPEMPGLRIELAKVFE